MKAADPACALPLGPFAHSLRPLLGSQLGVPYNRVHIDRAGRTLWNGVVVEPRLLSQYIATAAASGPPPILAISPVRDAPCAVVRETLSVAVARGRCSPERCAFEWPGEGSPPLLPERSRLLGNWILVSIDGAAPPPNAPPIEVIFTDGEVGARSQCISFAWLYGVEEGKLWMRVPNRPVSMCARGLSDWERKFQAAMPAASYIEEAGPEMIVTGPKGKLRLKSPD